MKKIICCTIIVSIAVACHKKSIPEITRRTNEPVYPSADTLSAKTNPEAGLTIFANRCGRCHDLPKTEQYTAKRWETIMVSMAVKARLDKDQAMNVTAYLKSHAKPE
jgi:hypothetical protein